MGLQAFSGYRDVVQKYVAEVLNGNKALWHMSLCVLNFVNGLTSRIGFDVTQTLYEATLVNRFAGRGF